MIKQPVGWIKKELHLSRSNMESYKGEAMCHTYGSLIRNSKSRERKKIMARTLVQTHMAWCRMSRRVPFRAGKVFRMRSRLWGNYAFARPQPSEAWPNVRQTTHFGPMAMQPPVIPAELLRRLSMSEDCLTLNIWSPGADEKLRPVLGLDSWWWLADWLRPFA